MEKEHVSSLTKPVREPWTKESLSVLRPSQVWSIRTKPQMAGKRRDLALFNQAIDSKLRDCGVFAMRDDVAPNGYSVDRATNRHNKTGRPVRFEFRRDMRSMSTCV